MVESFKQHLQESEERDKAFQRMAEAQRQGDAEALGSMSNKYEPLTTGLYGHSLEHIGDLTHRLGEKFSFFKGKEAIPKVENQLNYLTNKYGYKKEVREQIISNAGRMDISPEEAVERVKEYGERYADAHRKIPVFNKLQEHARSAAIALGEWRFDDVVRHLEWIKDKVDKGTFEEEAGRFGEER